MSTARLRAEPDPALVELGWPVAVDPRTHRPIVITGELLDAIVMPDVFGDLVLAELRISLLAGPVIAATERGPWIFLTQPANSRWRLVPSELEPFGVLLVPLGTRIPLPDNERTSRRWVQPAAPLSDLSIWSTVIGAARKVAARLPRGLSRPKRAA